ncbi:MAG: formate dehydrogenase accessory sulfurtransferase FdhD [Spirochaetaceae bacterium]
MRRPTDIFDDTTAVLLCGGDSRRLGYPKEVLRVDGEPLAVKLVKWLAALFPRVMVSTNRPERLRHLLDVPLVSDEHEGLGPLGGILSALHRAEMRRVLFLPCDTPGIGKEAIAHLLSAALRSEHPAAMAVVDGRPEPVFCVMETRLTPVLEDLLADGKGRAIRALFDRSGVENVEFTGWPRETFADIDSPEDIRVLGRFYRDVEPLPVRFQRITRLDGGRGSGGGGSNGGTAAVPSGTGAGSPSTSAAPSKRRDVVACEWPVTIHANSVELATVLCLPQAMREMAVGFACYLGLVGRREDVLSVEPDYRMRSVRMELDVEPEALEGAARGLVTSSCGSSVFGTPITVEERTGAAGGVAASAGSILSWLRGLRGASPVFEMTGATHQAAYCEGDRLLYLYEDVGRHNAVDKVLGRALLDGRDLSRGVLLATGRISSEMVIKALRLSVPVIAGRAAVTSHALDLADERGITVVGFARGGRLNVYTRPGRIV